MAFHFIETPLSVLQSGALASHSWTDRQSVLRQLQRIADRALKLVAKWKDEKFTDRIRLDEDGLMATLCLSEDEVFVYFQSVQAHFGISLPDELRINLMTVREFVDLILTALDYTLWYPGRESWEIDPEEGAISDKDGEDEETETGNGKENSETDNDGTKEKEFVTDDGSDDGMYEDEEPLRAGRESDLYSAVC